MMRKTTTLSFLWRVCLCLCFSGGEDDLERKLTLQLQETYASRSPARNSENKPKLHNEDLEVMTRSKILERVFQGQTNHTSDIGRDDTVDQQSSVRFTEIYPNNNVFDDLEKLRVISLVIVAHNEQQYLQKTLESILLANGKEFLKEIIIFDDASQPSMQSVIDEQEYKIKCKNNQNCSLLRFFRSDTRVGLIKAKNLGADLVDKDNILIFLDSHIKPDKNWLAPMIRLLNEKERRVVVPRVPILNPKTWEIEKVSELTKMMFEWNLEFHWIQGAYEDDDEDDIAIPIMPGGIFAIRKSVFDELGGFDNKMNLWGSENIEMSLRIWLCGGDIVAAKDSIVGHIYRSSFPYQVDVNEIIINKIRTVLVWFDDYKDYFFQAHKKAQQYRHIIEGDINERLDLKKKLSCHSFEWFVNRFKRYFYKLRMLTRSAFHMCAKSENDANQLRCLTVGGKNELVFMPFDSNSLRQTWTIQDQTFMNFYNNKCIDASNPPSMTVEWAAAYNSLGTEISTSIFHTDTDRARYYPRHQAILYQCQKRNHNQQFSILPKTFQLAHGTYCLESAGSQETGMAAVLAACEDYKKPVGDNNSINADVTLESVLSDFRVFRDGQNISQTLSQTFFFLNWKQL